MSWRSREAENSPVKPVHRRFRKDTVEISQTSWRRGWKIRFLGDGEGRRRESVSWEEQMLPEI